MDTSKLLTLGIVGLGLYVLYEWFISQCETTSSPFFGSSPCQMLLGTSVLPATSTTASTTTSTTGTTPVTTVPVTPTVSPLIAVLQQAAGTTGSMTPDQWSYYYQAIPGKPAIPPAQFENILSELGLTDATRSTPVTAAAFVSALSENGLSGLGYFRTGWVPMGAIHGGRWA
jgi:hypothetical protein